MLLGLQACFEGEEACLDPSAINYDVTGDENCGTACCTYPSLSLAFLHKAVQNGDTTNLTYNQAYTNNVGMSFSIEEISYYLSEVHLIDTDGNEILVEDRIDIPVLENGTDTTFFELEDNFAIINPANFQNSSIGTLLFEGTATSLKLTFGLPLSINDSAPELFTEGHPLGTQEPAMYDSLNQNYIYNRISYYPDTSLIGGTSSVIEITGEEAVFSVVLPLGEVNVDRGFNITCTIELNYLGWFDGVDFTVMDETTIKNLIVNNIANHLSIISISFSS